MVAQFGENGIFADEVTEKGVSGAVLAYREVYCAMWHGILTSGKSEGLKDFANLAGIYDTWVRDSPRWEEACDQVEALRFFPSELWFKQLGTKKLGAKYFQPALPGDKSPVRLEAGFVFFDGRKTLSKSTYLDVLRGFYGTFVPPNRLERALKAVANENSAAPAEIPLRSLSG